MAFATKLTRKMVDDITTGNDELLSCVAKNHDFSFPEDEMYNLYWSEKDKATVIAALGMVNASNASSYASNIVSFQFKHETLQEQIEVSASVGSHAYGKSKYAHLLPHGFHVHRLIKYSPVISETFKRYLELSYIVGECKSILRNLLNNCTSLEQIRYLFPPITRILRHQGYDALANSIEEVKGAPRSLPPLDHHTKVMLRFLVQWYATQELLENFYSRKTLPLKVTSEGTRTLKFTSTVYVSTSSGAHINFSPL